MVEKFPTNVNLAFSAKFWVSVRSSLEPTGPPNPTGVQGNPWRWSWGLMAVACGCCLALGFFMGSASDSTASLWTAPAAQRCALRPKHPNPHFWAQNHTFFQPKWAGFRLPFQALFGFVWPQARPLPRCHRSSPCLSGLWSQHWRPPNWAYPGVR